MLSIRLSSQIEKRLNSLAKKTGRTKTYYVTQAILEHLDELEELYLSLERLEKPARRWKLAELEKAMRSG